ncbi:MAG: ATP-dependent DNA ligase [Dehalococcoidales bacterium]|nr:ATP-dependent DNA ligase [Dehalococcoidales bacterium]
MLFTTLAEYFERLEQTTGRNAMVQILSELLREPAPDEVDKVTYLCQGRLVPFFEPLEMGVGERLAQDAIAQAFDTTRDEAQGLYDRLGDLGLAAGELAQAHEQAVVDGLTVATVYQQLDEMARATGSGSVERRVGILAALLKSMDPRSAKYLMRIAVGTLRLGIGDPTILDALSVMQAGDKSLRATLEGAYNITSDLGLIARTLRESGVEAIGELHIEVGRPIRPALAERLPDAEAIIQKLGRAAAEPKYDGFRVQCHKDGDTVKLFSRRLENMTGMFPEIVEGVCAQVKVEKAIIEGEAVAYSPESEEYYPFQETTKRRRKYKIEETMAALPLRLFVFDVLYVDGEDVMKRPYVERREILKRAVEDGDALSIAQEVIIDNPHDLLAFFDDQVQKGLEGVVAKRLDSVYQAGGRNFNWVKLKRSVAGQLRDTVDCVILGYIYGRGKRTSFGAGALLVGVYDQGKDEFVSVTKIGTGLTDEEWREIRARCDRIATEAKPARVSTIIVPSIWVQPEVVIEVRADEITRSPVHTCGKVNGEPGYALRFPRLVSFRGEDKRPEDATTVVEVIEMYERQVHLQVAP